MNLDTSDGVAACAPHLFQPDYARKLWLLIGGGDVPTLDSGEDAKPVDPVKQTRQRKPSVASVIRQMKRAGVEIAGCEINPRDGTVKVITGKPFGAGDIGMDDTPSPEDRSEWK